MILSMILPTAEVLFELFQKTDIGNVTLCSVFCGREHSMKTTLHSLQRTTHSRQQIIDTQ